MKDQTNRPLLAAVGLFATGLFIVDLLTSSGVTVWMAYTAVVLISLWLPERRHIDGRELAQACRDLALERFGVMARLVLEHWGVMRTEDLGDIVFTLVSVGLLISQPTDSRDDFADVFSFDEAFEDAYPWSAAHLA